MYKILPEIRLNIVQYYLKNSATLRETARKYNVHYQSVFKWVKLYKEQGEERLLSTYRRPWNRTKKNLEEKIVLLKEKEPPLTVRKAKEILEKYGIEISIKGIWGVWKRYGYAGFKKENMSDDFTEYCPWTKEAKKKFEQANKMFNLGKVKESATILNSIPSLPKNTLILQLPDKFLNLRRKVEKASSMFGKIPLRAYLRRIKKLYEELRRKKLNYSALRIGNAEIVALLWKAKPEEQLKRIEELKKIIISSNFRRLNRLNEPNRPDKPNYYSYLLFEPLFILHIAEGVTYAQLYKTKKAAEIAAACRRSLKLRKYISPYFMANLGALYMNLEDFREAEYWLLKSVDRVDEETCKALKGYLGVIFLQAGKYKEASNLSKYAEFYEWGTRSWRFFFLSLASLIKGSPKEAISLCTKSLYCAKKEELNLNILHASFTIASIYCSIGEETKARRMLLRALLFSKRKKLKKYVNIIEVLLSQNKNLELETVKLSENIFPTVKLALLLRNAKYRKALFYAKKKGIISYLHRFIFFFPEEVINMLEKGKSTGLPKTILRLPVFNKEVPVYNIRFLGDLKVFKNQNYLKTKLRPKDTAFLIQLALKAGEPDKKISLDKLYFNFWRNSINPPRNLSHLLVRIKKLLKIPSHLLEVSYKKANPVLINRGIHFITDYDEYKQTLAQAKALLRAGEWGFAKREFIRAFKLFRGEPFRKMYDDWSDDKRLEVLFSYEKEVKTFAEELIKRGRREEAERLIKRRRG